MSFLKLKLLQLQEELIPGDEIEEDMLHELVWDIDDTFGSEHNIFDFSEEELKSLPDNLQ